MSPNYGEGKQYRDRESCTISIGAGSPAIEVVDFSTESDYDKLTVNYIGGTKTISGAEGSLVNGIVPTAEITWTSDNSVTAAGWKLCPSTSPSSGSGYGSGYGFGSGYGSGSSWMPSYPSPSYGSGYGSGYGFGSGYGSGSW
jgi:hypothetical protein